MLLRDHPLMCYRGTRNWPPVWTWIGGPANKRPQGEIGILRKVSLSKIQPFNRCYLYVNHDGSSYVGSLLFDDAAFGKHIAEILRFCGNHPIEEIGSLDVSRPLPN
jgi:hypothetical protein